jgi:predicted TIM-barrel fold metal-dependent hydrolase
VAPAAVFDAHFHVIDPRFPLTANDGYLPPPFAVDDYRRAMAQWPVQGGAVVSASFQGVDQTYLRAALASLGPGFVGVTHLPASVTDGQIEELSAAGVRAVRFNLVRGGSAGIGDLATLGRRVHDVAGWHVELYVDGSDLPGLVPHLKGLPLVGIDHLGLSLAGLDHVVHHVANGGFVKASGFGRLEAGVDTAAALQRLVDANPDGVVFGSDLPGTRAARAFAPRDVELVTTALGPRLAAKVLVDNALAIYRPRVGSAAGHPVG